MTIKLLDVEDRPVAVITQASGARAFVWNSTGWVETPALLGKSLVAGITLTPSEFAKEFPQADVTKLSVEG
ncbi:MAG: hypothetical protein B7Y36_08045 [Novosphingobium sp. 28-62-57]|uniref:hypothetical protein n=1 Tax=unclassified Novosphingobium TaxID=2644732 RepID=UPI000BDBE62E|nr:MULTISPECIES: hypothetical protein [unclassified Novosphingobium]OYW47878.1 MAG: hypothetical protein B7Z36_01135 [Novosphingobium sp. 12-63-9]OYZ10771.1 MAG: hypothetical protein B7Y36_08045 [Novosphingobium sp. 28-62-57]OZA36458.1 MAG: hypothetical protein B7X92_06305 [Novosphingobium sp. 17-62-9]HQS68963.1 hypothetical protein [Novosphingobium sp.]